MQLWCCYIAGFAFCVPWYSNNLIENAWHQRFFLVVDIYTFSRDQWILFVDCFIVLCPTNASLHCQCLVHFLFFSIFTTVTQPTTSTGNDMQFNHSFLYTFVFFYFRYFWIRYKLTRYF